MDIIFKLVAGILYVLSLLFGVSYVEMNIIVYYFFIPITWVILLDAIFKFHWFKVAAFVGYVALYFCMESWTSFCVWAFKKSVTLLNLKLNIEDVHELAIVSISDSGNIMNNVFVNPAYIRNSVIICVFVPVIVYTVLIYLLVKKQKKLKNKP